MSTDTVEQETEASTSGDDTLEAVSSTRQFVTFIAGDEVFAVDMAPVQEIIRLPDVVRVPMAPASLDGLANLRGKVLPIISLRRLFGFAEQAPDDATRAVIIDVGQPLGFVVDRVASVVGVEPGQIEDASAIRSTVDSELLSGIIKGVGGHAMIMVLDFDKLIAREFSRIPAITRAAGLSSGLPVAADDEDLQSDELQLVSFNVADQEYAIAIEDVQEIVQVPDNIIHVPHADSHVIGVMTLRSRLLPLVSLRRMFGLDDESLNEKFRIVVLALGSASVGVVVDGVSEVLRVPKHSVDAMPRLLAKDPELSDIGEICRLDEGKRLVSIISVRALFDQSAVEEALSSVNQTDQHHSKKAVDLDEDHEDDDEQVVVFHLDREEFGVPIHSVQEIVRVPDDLVHVPRAPSFVEGVINLRGSVLPVIDLRVRLGLPRVARSDRQRIMVFLIADVRTGFIVDEVAQVLKIPRAVIEPAPQLSAGSGRLLSRMANMAEQKRMVQLLEPAHLIEAEELSSLAAVKP